jgi:eukaryotic-like serine/threonine-protein kinase
MIGQMLGPYRILEKLGEGGMGEVYKARDTRLDRTVAIKVLPEGMVADPDRRRRFEQEARAASALNHPHICVLHDIGSQAPSTGSGQAVDYLVMEYLDGQTLAHRLRKGSLPLTQVLEFGGQIADALAAAHRAGIVHRDLKPANIMLTRSGGARPGSPQARLLDFGLAKLKPQPTAGVVGASALSTQEPATTPGAVMGTVPYMAPEQLEGKEADARTDLFAFGCVLYEMLTGRRAFPGETEASVIAAIMTREPPPLSSLPPDTPPALGRLVRACLAKDPDARRQSAHDVAEDIRGLLEAGDAQAATTGPPRRRRALQAALVVAGALLMAAGASVTWFFQPSTHFLTRARVSLDLRPAEEVNAGGVTEFHLPAGGARTAFAWTPDGRAVVFVGRRAGTQHLYVRPLDAEARVLAGTEGAQAPAVSADGQWIAFWSRSAIRKVAIAGGPVVELHGNVTLPPWGLGWDARGGLFFGASDGPLWAISPDGAASAITTVSETEIGHGLPCPLPNGRALLYTVKKQRFTSGDEEIVALVPGTATSKLVLRHAADARFVPTGHLVFLRQGTLFAVRFDPDRLEVQGAPVPMLDSVSQAVIGNHAADVTSAGQFAVSTVGTLAWIPAAPVSAPVRTLVSVDRQGRVSMPVMPPRTYGVRVRLAPGGRELAVSIWSTDRTGLWTHDLARPGTLAQLLEDGEASCPIWTPDGQRITFWWNKNGRRSVAWQPADGTAAPEVLAPGDLEPSSWTPDGRQLAAVNFSGGDAVIVTRDGQGTSTKPLPRAPNSRIWWPEFSPDGRWLAYGSDESGRFEVYVRPYPGLGQATQVSTDGGIDPAWRPDGRALFFLLHSDKSGVFRMMEAEFQPDSPARPRQLFEFVGTELLFAAFHVRPYDVAPDGKGFFVLQNQPLSPSPVATQINLIQDWFEELKAKAPVRR